MKVTTAWQKSSASSKSTQPDAYRSQATGQCLGEVVTQCADASVVESDNSVMCSTALGAYQHWFGRSYDLSQGVTEGYGVFVDCVTIGAQSNNQDTTVMVNLYEDVDGDAAPGSSADDLVLLGSQPVAFLQADGWPQLQTAVFAEPVELVAGARLFVEVVVPEQRSLGSPGFFLIASNGLGETEASWIRTVASQCGLDNWATTSDVGFSNMHLVQSLSVTLGDPVDPCTQPLSENCSADISGIDGEPDGVVNIDDFSALLVSWGACGDGQERPVGDCAPMPNGDCCVDLSDFTQLLVQFGSTCVNDPGSGDIDGDGVPDDWEAALDLNRFSPDSDGDGVSDGDEDYDGDGLGNAWEIAVGLDPSVADSDGDDIADGDEDQDGDGMSNAWEIGAGLDPLAGGDGFIDSDGDGLFNVDEFAFGSDPWSADSEGDGLGDAQEYQYGSDPWSADSDGDGFDDALEVAQGTIPNDALDQGDPANVVEVRLGFGNMYTDNDADEIPIWACSLGGQQVLNTNLSNPEYCDYGSMICSEMMSSDSFRVIRGRTYEASFTLKGVGQWGWNDANDECQFLGYTGGADIDDFSISGPKNCLADWDSAPFLNCLGVCGMSGGCDPTDKIAIVTVYEQVTLDVTHAGGDEPLVIPNLSAGQELVEVNIATQHFDAGEWAIRSIPSNMVYFDAAGLEPILASSLNDHNNPPYDQAQTPLPSSVWVKPWAIDGFERKSIESLRVLCHPQRPNGAWCSDMFREVEFRPFVLDLRADSNRNGLVESEFIEFSEETPADEINEDAWTYGKFEDGGHGAIILVNNDDDDNNGKPDFQESLIETSTPNSPVYLAEKQDYQELSFRTLPDWITNSSSGWQVYLETDDGEHLRFAIYACPPVSASNKQILGPQAFNTLSSGVVRSDDLKQYFNNEILSWKPLWIAARCYPGTHADASGTLITADATWDGLIDLRLVIEGNGQTFKDEIQLRVAPWLMPSHADTAQTVYVTDIMPPRPVGSPEWAQYGEQAKSWPDRVKDAAGSIDVQTISSTDLWPQDQFEVGFHSVPFALGADVHDVVLISHRDLHNGFPDAVKAHYLETEFDSNGLVVSGTNSGVAVLPYIGVAAGPEDYFGNLECMLPSGVTQSTGSENTTKPHALGNPIYGSGINSAYKTFLQDQASQKDAVSIVSSFTLVGHIDEFMSFAVNDVGDKYLFVADPVAGMNILQADPNFSLPPKTTLKEKWQVSSYVKANVSPDSVEVVAGTGNTWVQIDAYTAELLWQAFGSQQKAENIKFMIDAAVAGLPRNYLTDVTIVKLPVLFFEDQASFVSAITPNAINMLNLGGKLVIPDPTYEPLINGATAANGTHLPGITEILQDNGFSNVVYIDCIEHHNAHGQVHCGSNVRREPSELLQKWWEHQPPSATP